MPVTHSMQRGILWAMSSVLKFCLRVPLTHSAHLEAVRVGDLVGGDDVRPIGAKVSRDFIW